ncbi:hypothetical protein BT93_B0395 [Corymbia citriodora subsp. variegata]|nr:hypothetical protein BT93_B0395 [Corymbia citriodora subsp. variegata]
MEVIKLQKLYWLYLTNCSIRGQIPEGIGNLTLLENLELSDNDLSGEIPWRIIRLGWLWQLELYNNSLTAFKEPVDRRFQRSSESSRILPNSLYANRWTSSLPPKLGSWADFNYIDVSDNSLTGSISSDMCKNGKMTYLLLLDNKLTGTISVAYVNYSSFVRVHLCNNLITSAVLAGIWGLLNLIIIDHVANQLKGSIKSDIRSRIWGLLNLIIITGSDVRSIFLGLDSIEFEWICGKYSSTIGNLI